MAESISRSMINALLPPGSIWIPSSGDDLDLFFEGMADNMELIRSDLDNLASIRNPQLTVILDDLEKEWGVPFNPLLTEQERRDQLEATKLATQGDGTDSFIQAQLQEAGFDVQVHENEPPIDPTIILDAEFLIYCDGNGAFCGHQDALCGRSSGELIANGDPLFDIFSSPASSDYWHLIFFIGGDATRNGITDALEAIQPAQVPFARVEELIRLIVKYKPLHAWCGLIIEPI